MAHVESLEDKKKKYFKIFWVLLAFTVFEVTIVYMPLPKVLISILVCLAAMSKAGCVGYYYMHLEHETRWLQLVALLPLIAFGYAFVLMPDTHYSRPISIYYPENPRTFADPEAAEEAHEGAESGAAEHGEKPAEAVQYKDVTVSSAPTEGKTEAKAAEAKVPEAKLQGAKKDETAPAAGTAPANGATPAKGAGPDPKANEKPAAAPAQSGGGAWN